jgi:hypothetical protein
MYAIMKLVYGVLLGVVIGVVLAGGIFYIYDGSNADDDYFSDFEKEIEKQLEISKKKDEERMKNLEKLKEDLGELLSLEDVKSCESDEDCTLIREGCCCSMSEKGWNYINKKYAEEWNNNRELKCEGIGCLAVGCQFPEYGCVENKCQNITSG